MSLLVETAPAAPVLSPMRLRLLRGGYLFMGLGLVLVKWHLLPDAHALLLYEGVTLCLLVAMSLLALAGVWRPVRMLPVLVLEVLWKLIWLSLVALPRAVAGGLDAGFAEVAVSCSFVVVILVAVPWAYVWRSYARLYPSSTSTT